MKATSLMTAATFVAGIALAWTPTHAADSMKMTFNWLAGAAHLGFIYGDELGFYKDVGIDIEFEEGRGSGPTSQMVATGQTDIGMASATAALTTASKGAPIVVISPLFQVNSFGVISLAETGIATPSDLVGKKVGTSAGKAGTALFDAMLAAQEIDPSTIEIVNMDSKAMTGMLEQKVVDAVVNVPSQVQFPLMDRDIETRMLFFRDHGAPTINLAIIANSDKLKANPDLYRRFLSASLKGWAATRAAPEKAIAALRARYVDAKGADTLLRQFTGYISDLICPPGAAKIGLAPDTTWDVTYRILTERLNFPAERPITAYYTNDYIPADSPACVTH